MRNVSYISHLILVAFINTNHNFMEEENPLEAKEKLDEIQEHATGWIRYLSVSTAIIAVLAAIATLLSGNYANTALLKKNDAILAQSKASDQWNYYEAKGVKRSVDEGFYAQRPDPALKAEIDKYTLQQVDIQKEARGFEAQVTDLDNQSEAYLGRHHHLAIAVTLFQVAIALSAIAALLRTKPLWLLSLAGSLVAVVYLVLGLK